MRSAAQAKLTPDPPRSVTKKECSEKLSAPLAARVPTGLTDRHIMIRVRYMFWALALLSLSLAAAPAGTSPVGTKGKAAAKAPSKAAAQASTKSGVATKSSAKPSTVSRVPAKAAPLARAGTAAPRPGTAGARTAAPNRGATAARGRVVTQPQYSRYGNNRRQLASSRTPVRPRPLYKPAPMTPTPERTKEIQSALAQRGYLNSEASGTWDTESTDAMKRFQKDQNLDADGKLSSLSLIALGLGPKRTLTASSLPTPIPATPKP